ncbi:protein of unknown function [Bradyrhizobium sp. ORS 285]|nr:hypothetical protein BRAO285_1110039 [Bradyrhizobium sp. ORS 285]SMX57116.1 protein of unknown function [Bradyrhizobium sp. ORS 285]
MRSATGSYAGKPTVRYDRWCGTGAPHRAPLASDVAHQQQSETKQGNPGSTQKVTVPVCVFYLHFVRAYASIRGRLERELCKGLKCCSPPNFIPPRSDGRSARGGSGCRQRHWRPRC